MGDLENKKDGLVGKAKEAYGEATDNKDVANEGKADQVTSEAKDKPVSYTHLTLPTIYSV